LFAVAIYFYSIDKNQEIKKESPIFFEVIEETLKKEETAKEELKEETIKEEKPEIEKTNKEKADEEKAAEENPEEKEVKEEQIEKALPISHTTKEPAQPKPSPAKIDSEEKKPQPIKENVEKKLVESVKTPQETTIEKAKIVSSPSPVGKIIPIYPRSARRKGYEGKVIIEIEVSSLGSVVLSRVISSSGHKELDDAAIKAVNKATFSPATENGVNIQGKLRIPITFKLK
jgi:protein TonB